MNETENAPRISVVKEIAGIGPELTADDRKYIWSGAIGPDSRLETEPYIYERVERVLRDKAYLGRYFGPCDADAPEQCIDGRPSSKSSKRGPKVPGGTTVAAETRTVVENPEGQDGRTILDELENMVGSYEESKILFGAHIDNHASGEITGCGAVDKAIMILAKSTSVEANRQLRILVMTMLGRVNYSSDRFDLMAGRTISLLASKDEYFLKDPENGEFKYRQATMELLRESSPESSPVEELQGKHNEVGLVVNFVKGTTFYRDEFSRDNNDELQLFNYDFWRTEEVAYALYPDSDELSAEKLVANAEKRAQFIMFRAVNAVATAMVLTDGSVKLIVRN